MKIVQTRAVDYFESSTGFDIKLGALVKRLQEAAVHHSELVGFGSRDLMKNDNAWILNRLAVAITRWPSFRDPLTITTWHRGSRGFMAYREFLLTVGDAPVAAATSRWLYFDIRKKRVVRVPGETAEAYTVETARALDFDLDGWKPPGDAALESEVVLSTRASDYDPNGHVNNAAYFDYLETLLAMEYAGNAGLRQLVIQYQKEIPRNTRAVRVELSPGTDARSFTISGDADIHAAGQLRFHS
jgi:acyl-ACP thioesterase